MAPFDLVVATKSRSVPAVSSDRGVGIGKFAILNAVDIIGDLNTLGVLPKIPFKLTQSVQGELRKSCNFDSKLFQIFIF